jgi:localization factor PodJL
MARAFSRSHAEDTGPEPHPGEWQALRGELVALLDQVESQVARASRQQPEHGGLAERMRALRSEVGEPDHEDRHREALRTVKRAVDRFGERDESYGAAPTYPPNPQDSLRSAIQQIRARHAERPVAAAPRAAEPHFSELANAVSGISSRLGRLESELKAQARSQTGNVKEIADQVAQLSHVVELLAGAVGETGQVKRLEAQIAGLAKLIAQGPQVDLSALTQRLDDVTTTIGRLADLQVQVVERVDHPAQAVGMEAIEAGVRNIYDRIDAIEKHTALQPADLERLTDEMAQFTEAMRNPVQPQGLIELIDALNARIGDIESQHSDVGGLKADLEQLREVVVAAVEPRFAALEMQLESLTGRMDERPADIGIGQLEAQVRQLVARMDQTGEQLTGLAKLYNSREPQPAPDYEALAEMVASRTSDVIAQGSAAGAALNEAGMAEIEARLSRMLEDREAPSDDLDDMQAGIREVNERLARLEATLSARAKEAATPPPSEPAEPPAAPPSEAPLPAPAHVLMPAAAPAAEKAPRQRRSDAMPKNPADEAPLKDVPFAEAGPVRAALDAQGLERKVHPGLDRRQEPRAPEAPAAEAARPAFDPNLVARPRRPISSLEAPDAGVVPPVEAAGPQPGPAEAEPVSANTFIAAARRAAQRQQKPSAPPSAKAEAVSGSLIARAITGFQASRAGKAEAAASAPPAPSGKRDKKAPAVPPPAAEAPASAPIRDTPEAGKESFLSRHRKPILLGASLIAICFLTLNLISQRLGDDAAPAESAGSDTGALLSDELPIGDDLSDAADTAPRIIPRVDSLATASIDPAAARGFEPSTEIPAIPKRFSAAAADDTADASETIGSLPPLAAEITPLPAALESPVQVEMPPAGLGPEALLKAAADGDARAQFEVAAIYTEGRAVGEDLPAAAVWYERAAAQGFAPAQYRLGNLYEHGRGVERDLDQARLWYQRAAEAGNRMSMHNLAALYAGGELGEQQFDSAAVWFQQAAERGMKDSQFNLGMLYARGLGVTQDLETSYKWFSIAARSGDTDAAKARDDIARSLDAEAVGRLDAVIAAWQPSAIDLAANFAPIGTWSADFDPGSPIAKKEVIESVQTVLAHLGFDIGTADGLVGPKTTEAIRQFERATGMSERGEINPRLLAVLGSQPV